MEPHILDYDPHSGDYGLGFFGCSVGSAAFYVQHPKLGALCYLCNLKSGADSLSITPVDAYRRRVYLEPLGLHLVRILLVVVVVVVLVVLLVVVLVVVVVVVVGMIKYNRHVK